MLRSRLGAAVRETSTPPQVWWHALPAATAPCAGVWVVPRQAGRNTELRSPGKARGAAAEMPGGWEQEPSFPESKTQASSTRFVRS